MNNSASTTPSLAEQIANFKVTKCAPGRAETMDWGQCASTTYESSSNPSLPEHFSELHPAAFADPVTTPKAKTAWPNNKKQRKKKAPATFL